MTWIGEENIFASTARVNVTQNIFKCRECPNFIPMENAGDHQEVEEYRDKIVVEVDFLDRRDYLDFSSFKPQNSWSAVRVHTSFVALFQTEDDAVLFKMAVT
jgi:hypothetical protein